jgi:hypothetical protein
VVPDEGVRGEQGSDGAGGPSRESMNVFNICLI